MNLEIQNRQRAVKVNARAVRRLAVWLLRLAERRDSRAAAWGSVTVVLCDDAGMAAVNRVHLGRDATTDVIVYRYDPQPGDPAAIDGDLLVNVERALAEATQRSCVGGPDAELALYLAHACDHLAGADDDTPARRRAMRQRELAWRRRARYAGLTQGLIDQTPTGGRAARRAP